MAVETKNYRILVIFGFVKPHGAENATFRIFKALKDEGVKAYFITNKEWGHVYIDKRIDELCFPRAGALFGPNLGTDIIYKPQKLFLVIKGILRTSFSVVKAVKYFRPTHIYSTNMLFSFYSLPALLFLRLPVIYYLQDLIPKGLIGIFFRQIIARRVTYFICISNFIKRHALDNNIPEEKLTVIHAHSPVYMKEIKNTGYIYRKKANEFIITYTGQIHAYKGVHIFIQAAIEYAKERKDTVFYIAGEYLYGNPFAINEMKHIKDLGLNDRIIFLGYIENQDLLLQLLKESDIHCVPSLWEEPLGNVVLEAKTAGIPSVIFPSGGLPEMIEHKVDGYICREKTTAALREGISYFLDNKTILEEAKKKAHESLKKFDHNALNSKWMEIFYKTITPLRGCTNGSR